MPKLKTPTPTHWTKCQLGNFIFLRNGYAFASSSYQKQGIPLVRISNLTTTHQVIFDETICVEDKPEYQNFVITKGDLLLAMSGATTGKLAIYDSSIKAFQNQRVGNLKILDENVCYDKFRNYLFFSLSSTILKLAYGGAQPNISGDKLLSLQCFLPPLAEQKRIVKKIEELFAVIDKNIQKLEHTQQSLIQYRQSVLNLYFKKSRAPKQKIKMLCQVVRGGSPRPAGDLRFYNGPIPFLKVADLTHSSGKFITTAEHSIKPAGLVKTRQVPANTLLLSNSGATLGVPKICSFSTTFNDGIAAFLNLPPETLDYHYYFWCSKTQELRNINQGAAQPNLNTTIIENTEIPVPSLPEQKAIVEKIEKAFACADNAQAAISAALEQAKQLKQSILKRAFEGRLVPQDPNDKPVDLTQLTTKGKTK